MAEQYIVYVAAPTEEPGPETRERLSELLGLDLHKLDLLLRRLPGEVTRPIPEATAVTVARRFREAGLQASIRAPGTLDAGTAAPPPVGAPLSVDETTAGPAEPTIRHDRNDIASGRGTRDEPNIWKTQFGAKERVEPEEIEDDEQGEDLFPKSSFAPPDGPKAPSRGLLFALLLVVLVLVVLWFLF